MTAGSPDPLLGGPSIGGKLDVNAVASKMPDEQVAEFLLAWEKEQRTGLEATARRVARTQRERFRRRLTVLVVVLAIAEGAVAIYFAAFDEHHWNMIKDGLAYAAAPVAVLIGAIASFWYPSGAAD